VHSAGARVISLQKPGWIFAKSRENERWASFTAHMGKSYKRTPKILENSVQNGFSSHLDLPGRTVLKYY
jgi:hypothetical protein